MVEVRELGPGYGAAIDGVDLLFVGPSDLSQALGVPGEFLHPKCLAALDAVSAACRAHGKTWGAVSANPEHARAMIQRGLSMLSPSNDVKIVNAQARRSVAQQDVEFGKDLFARDPNHCCAMRKVEPLTETLAGYDAWVTGVRRVEAPTRAGTPLVT